MTWQALPETLVLLREEKAYRDPGACHSGKCRGHARTSPPNKNKFLHFASPVSKEEENFL